MPETMDGVRMNDLKLGFFTNSTLSIWCLVVSFKYNMQSYQNKSFFTPHLNLCPMMEYSLS